MNEPAISEELLLNKLAKLQTRHLRDVFKLFGSMSHPSVVRVSQELDRTVLRLQQLKRSSDK